MQRGRVAAISAVVALLGASLVLPAGAASAGKSPKRSDGTGAAQKTRALKRVVARIDGRAGGAEVSPGSLEFQSKPLEMNGAEVAIIVVSEGSIPVGIVESSYETKKVEDTFNLIFLMHDLLLNNKMTRSEINGAVNFGTLTMISRATGAVKTDALDSYVGVDLVGRTKASKVKDITPEGCTGSKKRVNMTMKGRFLIDTDDDNGKKRWGKLPGRWIRYSEDYSCGDGRGAETPAPTGLPVECDETASMTFTDKAIDGSLSASTGPEGTVITSQRTLFGFPLFLSMQSLTEKLPAGAFTFNLGGTSSVDAGGAPGFEGTLEATVSGDPSFEPGDCSEWTESSQSAAAAGEFLGRSGWGFDVTPDHLGSGSVTGHFHSPPT